MVDRVDINNLLAQMRQIKSQANGLDSELNSQRAALEQSRPGAIGAADGAAKPPGFAEMLSQAVDQVNEVQQNSSAVTNAYVKGDPAVDIADVMVASQKSSVTFQAAVQVRNKLIEAYRDVMNMPV